MDTFSSTAVCPRVGFGLSPGIARAGFQGRGTGPTGEKATPDLKRLSADPTPTLQGDKVPADPAWEEPGGRGLC